jgi:hypothetical protein
MIVDDGVFGEEISGMNCPSPMIKVWSAAGTQKEMNFKS